MRFFSVFASHLRALPLLAVLAMFAFSSPSFAQTVGDVPLPDAPKALEDGSGKHDTTVGEVVGAHGDSHADEAHGEEHGDDHATKSHPVFEPEHGTWFNLPARTLFSTPEEKKHTAEVIERIEVAKARAAKGETPSAAEVAAIAKEERIKNAGAQASEKLSYEEKNLVLSAATLEAAKLKKQGAEMTKEQKELLKVHYVAKYDFLLFTPLLWGLVALLFIGAARKARIRPEGKGNSLSNTLEAALEAFQNYLIGVMGNDLARKYTPLIASFFFTILAANWLGLVPGMLSPSAMPAVPIAMAIVGFLAVHFIAIKEGGLKAWAMHFVGEPLWLAPLNVPLHIVGELIKPLSLALRLLCNVFGEEAVVFVLAGLAVSMLPIWLPIPFQIPMLLLGTFFGFLQALVFSTLLAIYLSIFMEHHGDHDHAGDHTEHAHDSHGNKEIVGHPTAQTVA